MNSAREIVNGNLLGHSLNRNVSVIGLVTNVNSNGCSFELKTVDNVNITVNLPSPLDDMLDGYVEVHGKCISKNVITAEDYIQFSPAQSDGFDIDAHNKLCALLQQVQDVFKND